MATTYSRLVTLSAGVTPVTLDAFGDFAGVHHRNFIRFVKKKPMVDAEAEIWVALDGSTASQDGDNLESVPARAAESDPMRVNGHEVRSRVQANGDLTISVWSSAAGDVTIEAVH